MAGWLAGGALLSPVLCFAAAVVVGRRRAEGAGFIKRLGGGGGGGGRELLGWCERQTANGPCRVPCAFSWIATGLGTRSRQSWRSRPARAQQETGSAGSLLA